MSVSFVVAMESVQEFDGEPKIVYQMLYPEGFDCVGVIDPEYPDYGPMPEENPWTMNVHNGGASVLLKTLGYEVEDTGSSVDGLISSVDGLIVDVAGLADRCAQALSMIRTIPDFDYGTPTRIQGGDGHATAIHCGLPEGYMKRNLTKLRELALIAQSQSAVISYY